MQSCAQSSTSRPCDLAAAGQPEDLPEAVVASTREVFDTMIMLTIEPQPPLVERIKEFHRSVSGIVGLSGQRRGMLAVHCPENVALAITEAMLGEACETINEEVKDTIGEVVNMVAGGIKTALQDLGETLELAVPSIIAGEAYAVNLLSQADWLMVPFGTAHGIFWVEFKLAKHH